MPSLFIRNMEKDMELVLRHVIVEEGKKRFAIYTNGTAGKMVREYLESEFGIYPEYVIDNIVYNGRDILNIIGFCYAAAIGTACVAFSIGGSKLSMRVYESHIEGRASVSAKIKDVYIAFDRISAISAASNIGSEFSYIGCELYYLEVHTQEGFEIVFYLDEENVDRVSQMLRDIIKINGKKMESDRV